MAVTDVEGTAPAALELEVPAKRRSILRYNSPLAQVSLLGLICFCCPGMFNALSGLGGGDQVDATTADKANTALYACFAVFAILGGGAQNLLGPRATLMLGALTYPLYAGSFLYYKHHPESQAFPVTAGALLGAGAGFLWAAQGAVMTSYPPPNRRGTYISLFWCIFNLGSVLGGLLPFSFNYHRSNKQPASVNVNNSTYIAFIAFMLVGAGLTVLVLPPAKIVRDDGTKATSRVVVTFSSPAAAEGAEILKLFTNWKMLLVLLPAWASSSTGTLFFYTDQFNGGVFTLRTKGLNNVFFWGAQMIGSTGIGYFLDFGFASRRKRGLFGVVAVAVVGTAIWGGGLANQLKYRGVELVDPIDFKDGHHRYAGPFMLYFCYGLLDAMFQSVIYWIIGALADDSQILSRYVGFFKGVQSAGAAVAWQVNRRHTPLRSQLIVNWALITVSYPLLALLVFMAVKDEDYSVSSVEDGKENDSNNKLSAPTSTM